jgi:hypothetical protein
VTLVSLVCDLVTMYKLIDDYFDIPNDNFIEFYTDSCTTRHKYKICKQHYSVNAFEFGLLIDVLIVQNSLTTAVVEAVTLYEFKLNNVDLSCRCSFFLRICSLGFVLPSGCTVAL